MSISQLPFKDMSLVTESEQICLFYLTFLWCCTIEKERRQSALTALNELGFIPSQQLHVRGFPANWFCHHEAQGFFFKISFTSCIHSGGEAVWTIKCSFWSSWQLSLPRHIQCVHVWYICTALAAECLFKEALLQNKGFEEGKVSFYV